jgi:predicted ATPase
LPAHSQSPAISTSQCLFVPAFARVDQTQCRYYEAELHRIKGELLRRITIYAECDRRRTSIAPKSIDDCGSQTAKSWELRAATGLSRLWAETGKAERG